MCIRDSNISEHFLKGRPSLNGFTGFTGIFISINNDHFLTIRKSCQHTGCKVPWALPRGDAVTAATSADQSENVCAFSHGQPVCMEPFCRTTSCIRWQQKPYLSLPSIGSTAVRLWRREMRGAVAEASLLPSFLPYDVVAKHSGKLQYFLISDAFPL